MILWFCNAESSNHTREKDHNTLNVGMKLFKMLLMKREQAHTKKWVSYRFSSLSCLESLQQLGRSCLSHQSITRYPEAPFLGQIKSGFLFFKHLQFEPVSHTLLKCNIFFLSDERNMIISLLPISWFPLIQKARFQCHERYSSFDTAWKVSCVHCLKAKLNSSKWISS